MNEIKIDSTVKCRKEMEVSGWMKEGQSSGKQSMEFGGKVTGILGEILVVEDGSSCSQVHRKNVTEVLP